MRPIKSERKPRERKTFGEEGAAAVPLLLDHKNLAVNHVRPLRS